MRDNRVELRADDHLLMSVAQQLRQPLLQIARQAELSRLLKTADPQTALADILISAESALTLVDNYVLGLQVAARGEILQSEPVAVTAILADAAHELTPTAKRYGVELQVDTGRAGLINTNRQHLQAAFVSLGYALIEALASNATDAPQAPLRLAAHRCRYGVVAGLYCGQEEISISALRRGRELQARAHQPHFSLSSAAGAGIFVADSLLQTLATKLTVSRYQHQYGLAAILPPVNQLQLV